MNVNASLYGQTMGVGLSWEDWQVISTINEVAKTWSVVAPNTDDDR